MTDSRFTSVFKDMTDLLNGMDIDDIGDLETLLMFLLARPITVAMYEEEESVDSIQITVWGDTIGYGSINEFPTTVVELALDGARLAVDVGPYDCSTSTVQAGSDVLAMTEDELVTALQRALGMVRIFNANEDE